MPVITRPIPFIPRKRKAALAEAPAGPLTLVAATYEVALWVDLTFDRAVDVSGLVGSEIVIYDGELASLVYTGTGTVSQPSPETVRVGLVAGDDWSEPGILLDAGAGNGIVAADDGAAWAAVTDVSLPFP